MPAICLSIWTGDYTFERDVSVLDDDVNGRNGPQLILAQDGVAVDGAVGSAADPVVGDRGGQDLNVVDDFFYTFNVLDRFFGVGLKSGTLSGATWPSRVTVPSGSTL